MLQRYVSASGGFFLANWPVMVLTIHICLWIVAFTSFDAQCNETTSGLALVSIALGLLNNCDYVESSTRLSSEAEPVSEENTFGVMM